MTTKPVPAPGWDAIDGAFAVLYPDVVPTRIGYGKPWRGAGQADGAGLAGCAVYPAEDHWHYITYGLSELFCKTSEDPAVSGFGIELTFRLARRPDAASPPVWAFGLLERIARYVWAGNLLRVGDHLSLGGPVDGFPGTRQTGFLLMPDLDLSEALMTPHGRLAFLQLVGITDAQQSRLAAEGKVSGVVGELAAGNPLLVTAA